MKKIYEFAKKRESSDDFDGYMEYLWSCLPIMNRLKQDPSLTQKNRNSLNVAEKEMRERLLRDDSK